MEKKYDVVLNSDGDCGYAECHYSYTKAEIRELVEAIKDWNDGDPVKFDEKWGKDLAKAYDEDPDELWDAFGYDYSTPSEAWEDSYGKDNPECWFEVHVDGKKLSF